MIGVSFGTIKIRSPIFVSFNSGRSLRLPSVASDIIANTFYAQSDVLRVEPAEPRME